MFGLEAQGNWADFTGSQRQHCSFPRSPTTSKIDAFGLFTGQVGYAWNNALLYVKGGAAVTSNQLPRHRYRRSGRRPVRDEQLYDTRWGGAVGISFEYGFTPNWSVGLEYDHLFMGRGTRHAHVERRTCGSRHVLAHR